MSGSGIKVIANFISRNPKAFVEAATKVNFKFDFRLKIFYWRMLSFWIKPLKH